jgi:hypothetical protein
MKKTADELNGEFSKEEVQMASGKVGTLVQCWWE